MILPGPRAIIVTPTKTPITPIPVITSGSTEDGSPEKIGNITTPGTTGSGSGQYSVVCCITGPDMSVYVTVTSTAPFSNFSENGDYCITKFLRWEG